MPGARCSTMPLRLWKLSSQLERRHVGCVGAPALRRTLSVAMAHGTALSMPDRAIDAFREEHPDIVLSVEEVTTETAIDMVRTGESDISLVGSAPQYLEEFDPMLVVETGVYAFVPEDNPLSARKELELSDLDGQPFVTFDSETTCTATSSRRARRQARIQISS